MRTRDYLPWGISWSENDYVEQDTESVYGKAEEDAILIVLVDDAPDEGEQEEDVVKEDGLARPVSKARPGDQDQMTQKQNFEF